MEVWKPYGSYEVSNLGNVKGKFGKILKPGLHSRRYLQITICENGNKKNMNVHRLVALCFLENPENKPEVDHINRKKTDNRVENLRWVTGSENTRNTGVHSDNKSGHKHIYTTFKNGCNECWRIYIGYLKIQKCFKKSKYTLEQVLEERSKLYLKHNINE